MKKQLCKRCKKDITFWVKQERHHVYCDICWQEYRNKWIEDREFKERVKYRKPKINIKEKVKKERDKYFTDFKLGLTQPI